MSTPVVYEKNGVVATITINRPAARNALTPEMLCRLADAFIDFQGDDSLRAAILTGAGELAFCAGGDLGSTLPLMTGARPAADAWDRRVTGDALVMAASSLRDFPLHKPVIAAVNGACLAAGFELLLGTDIRVAATHASFGLPEVQRGLVPFAGSMARLPRQIAHVHAMQILLTGRPFSAQRAVDIGLVNEVLAPDAVMPRCLELAQQMAGNSPFAMQQLKQTVIAASGTPLEQAWRLEDDCKKKVLASADAQEGPLAFMEKRAPRYTGR